MYKQGGSLNENTEISLSQNTDFILYSMTKDDSCLSHLNGKITLMINDMIFNENLTDNEEKQLKYRSSIRKFCTEIIINFKKQSLGLSFEDKEEKFDDNIIEKYLNEWFDLKIAKKSNTVGQTVKHVIE